MYSKQELRREMTLCVTLAILFSMMTLLTEITPLYGSSLLYTGPAAPVWVLGRCILRHLVGWNCNGRDLFFLSVQIQGWSPRSCFFVILYWWLFRLAADKLKPVKGLRKLCKMIEDHGLE